MEWKDLKFFKRVEMNWINFKECFPPPNTEILLYKPTSQFYGNYEVTNSDAVVNPFTQKQEIKSWTHWCLLLPPKENQGDQS